MQALAAWAQALWWGTILYYYWRQKERWRRVYFFMIIWISAYNFKATHSHSPWNQVVVAVKIHLILRCVTNIRGRVWKWVEGGREGVYFVDTNEPFLDKNRPSSATPNNRGPRFGSCGIKINIRNIKHAVLWFKYFIRKLTFTFIESITSNGVIPNVVILDAVSK